jgi:hypothetical protein
MGFLIVVVLAVFGASFIAGGIVGYLKSKGTLAKALSAAAIAAGIVIWAAILFLTPVASVVGP